MIVELSEFFNNPSLIDFGFIKIQYYAVTFYSDSINDLPLLEAVDFPKAVNPDAMLEKISLERGWEIIDLPIL